MEDQDEMSTDGSSYESDNSDEDEEVGDGDSDDSGQDEANDEIDDAMEQVLSASQPLKVRANNISTCLNFSNSNNILCVGTVTGDLECFNCEDMHLRQLGIHECFIDSACSSVDFSSDSEQAYCLSATEGFVSLNLQTNTMNFASFKSTTDLYCLKTLNEHTICVGGNSGHVYLWDTRQFRPTKFFEPDQTMYDEVGDYISCIITNKYQIAAGSGSGVVTIFDIRTSKALYQNSDSSADIVSLTSLPNKPIVIAGSLSSKLTIFSWTENRNAHQFEIVPRGICNEVKAINDSTILTAWDDGTLRVNSLFPHEVIGTVGVQKPAAEFADLSFDKKVAASIAIDKVIHLWDLEEIGENNVPNQDFFEDL